MSKVTIKLQEPILFLIGGQEHERAIARRRRIGTPHRTPANSRPGSRPPSPPLGISSIAPDGNYIPPFVPSPSRGSRGMSPAPIAGGSRSNSRSRALEGLTTGFGTVEEARAADEPPPAMLRGLLTMTLSKPSRIRSISVKLKGISRTDWPEGIGPRRLDVLEETQLISQSWTFFSASDSSAERRAASVGAGGRDNAEMLGRGRTGSRRSSSMMTPSRDMSVGYGSRDNRIHEDEQEESMTIEEQEEISTPVVSIPPSPSPEPSSPPPVQPWEPSPAYEKINSRNSSPAHEPLVIDLLNPTHSHIERSERRSATPTRSPLGPSFHRDPIRPALPHLNSSDSISISLERGRPSTRGSTATNSEEDGTATTTTESSENNLSSLPSPTAAVISPTKVTAPMQRNSSGGSIEPAASRNRNFSNGPPPARSASSRPGRSSSSTPSRFSLGGLGDVLRGKSRARETSTMREESRGRSREESPDSRKGERDQSRGRKTALKVLREVLNAGVETRLEDSDEEEIEEEENKKGWKEFRAGTYTYPISLPIPASLPPSISTDFGQVSYQLKGVINRAGALTSNLTFSTEVTLVSCPSQDDTEESESIVVERFWESQMRYHIALSGKSFPIGARIPIAIKLNPLAKMKLYRVTVFLEQRVNYFATDKKLTRHENPKKFPLLRIENANPKECLLPILSEEPNVLKNHPLKDFFINPTSSDDTTPSCFDPIGPWNLESFIQLPDCASKLNFSTAHDKANITITHLLKIMLRVERGDDEFLDSKGKRKLWDVIIETPIHILSCRCAQNALPAYTTANVPASGLGSLSCTYDHINSSPRGSNSIQRTSQSPAPAPPITVEQTLLFARLVAGEITAAGEVPPSYNASAEMIRERSLSVSTNGTARGRQTNRGGSQSSLSPPNSTTRSRSESSNGVGVRGGRSLSSLRS